MSPTNFCCETRTPKLGVNLFVRCSALTRKVWPTWGKYCDPCCAASCFPKTAIDTQGRAALRTVFSALCLALDPQEEAATVRHHVPNGWPGARNTKKSHSVGCLERQQGGCVLGVGWLWFTLKLRQRNEKLLFTFQTDCSLCFHPHPNTSKGQELWKMRLSNGGGNVKQSSDPLWFTSPDCRSDSCTFAIQCIHNMA